MRWRALVAITVLAANSLAQPVLGAPLFATTHPAINPTTEPAGDEKKWEFSLSAYTYFVPDDHEYVQPTLTADHGALHLEARYNYEALDTGSLFVGCNFSWGEKLTLELTPMIGGVFGEVNGVAPGYRLSINWNRLDFYAEGEFLIDCEDSSDSYFYVWNELGYSPTDWIRFGLAAQRTRLYESDVDIHPGFLLGFSWKQFEFTGYVFDVGFDDPTFVLGVAMGF